MKVFITDAKLNSTLATIRSLGKLGLKIIAGDETKYALSFFSRYVYQRFIYTDPLSNPQQFFEDVLRIITLKKVKLVIPMTDYTLLLFSKYRNRFPSFVNIPIPEYEIVCKVVNKRLTLQIAQEQNIPLPETIFISSPKEVLEIASKLNYPLVIKSSYASYHDEENNQIRRGNTIYINNSHELIEKYMELHKVSPYPLIQEMIFGQGYGFFTILDKEGNSFNEAAHCRIRESNPTGSASCLCQSIPVDKTMKKDALSLLRAINWWGPAMVEFKKDMKDGKFKLIEINGRLWGSLSLFIHAGIDYPRLFYKLSQGDKISTIKCYKVGVRCRHLRGDINHLVQVLKGPPKNWKFSYPNKFFTLINFLKFWGKNLRYYNFYSDDITPGIVDTLQYFTTMLANLIKKIFLWNINKKY